MPNMGHSRVIHWYIHGGSSYTAQTLPCLQARALFRPADHSVVELFIAVITYNYLVNEQRVKQIPGQDTGTRSEYQQLVIEADTGFGCYSVRQEITAQDRVNSAATNQLTLTCTCRLNYLTLTSTLYTVCLIFRPNHTAVAINLASKKSLSGAKLRRYNHRVRLTCILRLFH